jgi:hypothetical protein
LRTKHFRFERVSVATSGAVRKLCGIPAHRKIGRAPGSPGRGLAKPGRSWKVGSMDVAAPPVVEATVADAARTAVVTRNYYQNNLG